VKVAPPVAADAPPQSSVQPAPSAITPVAAPPKPLTPFTPLLPAAASDAVPIETKPAPSTAPDARSAPNAPVAPPQVPVTGTSDTAKLTQDDVTTRTVRPIFQIQGVRLIGPAGTIRVGLGTFKIGRAVDADVRLEDRQVSRAHALLFVEELSIAIEDLKTVNGTLVNGREIKGRQQIKAGDVVHVGDSTLKVEVI
jgi:pSer/pThr/pTyr-binding forkhead associated (FHA) protein